MSRVLKSWFHGGGPASAVVDRAAKWRKMEEADPYPRAAVKSRNCNLEPASEKFLFRIVLLEQHHPFKFLPIGREDPSLRESN